MKYALSIIPFIISIALLIRGKKTYFVMIVSTAIGVLISYCQPKHYNLPLFSISSWLEHVIFENITIIISIYLMGFLMQIITMSKTISYIEKWFQDHMTSISLFVSSVPILSAFMSLDDYLSCLTSGTISGKLAQNYHLEKPKIATIVNLTTVSICCISPISSWAPVINSSITNSGLPVSYGYLSLPYNIVIFFFVNYIIILCYRTTKKTHCLYKKVHNNNEIRQETSSSGIQLLLFIILTLLLSYLCFSKIIKIDAPLVGGCLTSILVILFKLHMVQMITPKQIYAALKLSLKEMSLLNLSLISIWSFTFVTSSHLGFNFFIIECYKTLAIPKNLTATIIFLFAALFSFLTGSSYASFSLFISLSSQLTLEHAIHHQLLAIAGAIGGSLFAVFSYSSDTTTLCAQSVDCNIKEIRKTQFIIIKPILFWGCLGYTLLATIKLNHITYPLVVVYLTICFTLSLSIKRGNFIPYINVFTPKKTSFKYNWTNNILIRLMEYAKIYWKFIRYNTHMLPLRLL